MKNFSDPTMYQEIRDRNQRGKIAFAILVMAAGITLLLKQMGMQIPHFLFTWPMILIGIGVIEFVKHGFQKVSAYVLVSVGSLFLINHLYPHFIEMRFVIPVVIVLVGFGILLKSIFPKKKQPSVVLFDDETKHNVQSNEDFIQSTAIFGGVTKNVVSKTFKGGKVTAIFGGTELNLMHADFTGEAELEITAVFGGITLAVPPHWTVKSELTSAFGGVDDKRRIEPNDEQNDKVLIIKGTCVFGGVEISNHV